MKIVKNQTTEYLTSNFSEDETEWTSSDTYNYTDERRDGHYIYKYAGTDGTNTEESPSVNSLKVSPKWVKIAPSNYYAMLDGETNTQTQNADTIEITISDTFYDTISLLEIEATSVTIDLRDSETDELLYTKDYDLIDTSFITDFVSYCFEESHIKTSIYANDIPIYKNAIMRVLIDATGSIAKCGRLVFGRSFYVGEAGYGANLSIESYSRKTVDEFGNTSLTHRESVNIDSYEVFVPTAKIPILRQKAKEFDAMAVLFVMDEKNETILENLLNFGYWQDFSILIPNAKTSTISLSIKGIL